MSITQKHHSPVEELLVNLISKLPLVKKSDVELTRPQQSHLGDFACNISLKLFSQLKQEIYIRYRIDSSRELAFLLKQQLESLIEEGLIDKQIVSKLEVAGPGFINIFLSPQYYLNMIGRQMLIDSPEKSSTRKKLIWGLEHTSPNPNKAMHIGHLRNNLVGMSLGRLWEAVGINVVYEKMDNDRGIAIAKLMWGFLQYARKDQSLEPTAHIWASDPSKWYSPEELSMRPDRFVDNLYVKASQAFDLDETNKQLIRQLVLDWEQRQPEIWQLWRHVLSLSYQGQELTLKRLRNRWDKVWYESQHYQIGQQMVDHGLAKGIFKQLSDGAVITQLESYHLPDTIVRKADGTSLYITQDMALVEIKLKELRANKLHWVVGPEQKLAFHQLFAVCEQLGIGKREQLEHLSYGYMSIKGHGKMSSRRGNVLFIDELLDIAHQKAKSLIKEPSFDDAEKELLAEKVGVGAVKYAILKVGREVDMAFDIDEALSLEGNSGPYLQYTFARACSVLRKASVSLQDLHELSDSWKSVKSGELIESYNNLDSKQLPQLIDRFQQLVVDAAYNNEPSLIANYLFELAKAFNSLYNAQPILTADLHTRLILLSLIVSVARIIRSGLSLLGIEAPEKM
ncbi:MAG TPA: arginine--tRNA ligase [Candidatus Woesebacteria bacterium]|mgnify:CR=1 FL=1|nr:arginine--tRNA ligase [Candidatus Woesebacteria bacterium]